MGMVIGLLCLTEEAEATILENVAKSFMRPDLDLQEALVAILDARSSLKEVQVSIQLTLTNYLRMEAVATSPKDSIDRIKINPRLPGIFHCLSCF